MIGDKIADQITSVSRKKPAMELHSKELYNNDERKEEDVEISENKRKTHKISPAEKQKLIDELRLIPKKDSYF